MERDAGDRVLVNLEDVEDVRSSGAARAEPSGRPRADIHPPRLATSPLQRSEGSQPNKDETNSSRALCLSTAPRSCCYPDNERPTASPPQRGAKTPLAVFYNYLRKLRWYTSDVVDRAAMACCAMDNAWLAVASARAATAHASQGGGGAAQAPSNSNGVPSASTRANVIELFRVSLVIPYLSSQRRRSSVRWWRALAPEEACAQLAIRCCTDVAVRST